MACAGCELAPGSCIGDHLPHLCALAAAGPEWRRHVAARSALIGASPPPPRPSAPGVPRPRDLLGLVRACPDRGSVLPLSLQPPGCCSGAELSGCRAGRGAVAGRVTLRDCMACAGAREPVVIRSETSSWTSYGRIARHLGLALEDLGVPVAYREAWRKPGPGAEDWLDARVGLPSARAWYVQMQEPFTGAGGPGRKVSYSMNESDTLAPPGAACFASAELVVVPTEACRAAFAAGGVDPAKVRVVPLGLCDPGGFTPKAAPPAGPVTFGMAGRQLHGRLRKGFDLGIAAFRRAFPRGDEDARLAIQTSDDVAIDAGGDPRIVVDRRVSAAAEMGAWYRGLDAYLCPSRGEGWGMHTHESMSCGVPAVVALWGGAAAFCDPSCCYPVAFALAPCSEPDLLNAGRWCEPSVGSMADQIRRVYGDREEAHAVGLRAAERAREFTWGRSAREFLEALKEFGFVGAPEA